MGENTAQETEAREKETDREVAMKKGVVQKMQPQERHWPRNQWMWVALASGQGEQSQIREGQDRVRREFRIPGQGDVE